MVHGWLKSKPECGIASGWLVPLEKHGYIRTETKIVSQIVHLH